ncbi:MAG TPA: hypothetical protein VHL56_08790 [Candidatus Limnocylindrales bacterium]|jgi:DNA-binding beta-propeller fold protein YncE|nr:hypothetical protein [Candidatus Limnocylindrales bacterium]
MTRSPATTILSLAATLALAGCQGAAQAQPSASSPAPASVAAAPTVAEPTALPEHVIAEWNVPAPAGIYAGVDSIWVPGHQSRTTTRIDPTTNTVTGVVPSADAEQLPPPEGFGSLWFATQENTVVRVDPKTNFVMATIPIAAGPMDIGNGLIVTDAAIWVLQSDHGQLIRINPATNKIVSTTQWTDLIAAARKKTTVPAGKGPAFLWIELAGDEGGGGISKGLLRLDLKTGAPLTFLPWAADQNGDGHLTITDDKVWYGAGGHLYRIDVATNRIDATYPIAPGIIHVAIGFGSVWLANYEAATVQRLDVAP